MPTVQEAVEGEAAKVKLSALAIYWIEHQEQLFPNKLLCLDWGEPFCFRCGWHVPETWASKASIEDRWLSAAGWLERCHLVDKMYGGTGTEENLVPLCVLCHDCMPTFTDREKALTWVVAGHRRHWTWQMYTDSHLRGRSWPPTRTSLIRAERDFYRLRERVREGIDIFTEPTEGLLNGTVVQHLALKEEPDSCPE